MKRRILLADNDGNFASTRAEYLEKAGYEVLQANSLEQTKRFLNDTHIHIAVLDIRMVDDDDEKDISGLILAKDVAYRPVPKIILTGFPTVQAVRQALGPALDGLPPAVDFLAKKDGPEAMIQAVEQAFAQFVHINFSLDIQWDLLKRLSFPHLVNLVQHDLPSDMLMQQANELEDLVRQLFYNYQQIRIGRLLWHDTWRFCLPVLARSPQGTTDSRLLVCGNRECLEQDREKLEEFAPKAIRGSKLSGKAETIHFGANFYELPDVDVETVQTLRDIFKVGKERLLKTVFEHLLGNVLVAWHQYGQTLQEKDDLMSLYRQWTGLTEKSTSKEQVEQRVEALVKSVRMLDATEIKKDKEQITFQFPHQLPVSCPNPVPMAYSPLAQYDASVICKISPGRLTADNILVDSKQSAWLTDFVFADQAPQWWDFVCLEAIVRFDLGQAPDLVAWQEFEECMLKPARLDEKLDQSHVIPELRTSVALIEQIRQQAANETGSELLPYYAGLLAWVVEAMSHYDSGILQTQIDRLRSAHLLLAASMIAGRLSTVTNTSLPEGRLHMDDDGGVWIGESRVAILSGLRQKLLACLLSHDGKVVNNRMIVEEVYNETYDPAREQSIRQEMSRLRNDVEPDSERSRYILTIRGKGYRLNTSGETDK